MTSSIFEKSSTEVYAASSGTVHILNNSCEPGNNCSNGFGNYVVIEHSTNLYSLYAHLDSVDVSKDQEVQQGDKIGMMGYTGSDDYTLNSSHLHFEVLKYTPTNSSDFGGGYSSSYPDSSRRTDPKEFFNNEVVKVVTDNLNVREAPIISGNNYNTIKNEQYYITLGHYNNWYFIYLPYKTIPNTSPSYVDVKRYGWVSGDYIETINDPQLQTTRINGQELWNENKTWVSVHTEPNITSSEITKVWPGQQFVILEYDDHWGKINLPASADQNNGWINIDLVTNVNNSEILINFSLLQNFPNPFNPVTNITYSLPMKSRVKLDIYNILGKKVKTLVDRYQTAGEYNIEFNAKDLSSGVYFYRIQTDNYVKTKKMILMR